MGNSQTTPRRKLEHTFPFLHNYKKLSPPPSSSSSSPTHPLLWNNKEFDKQDTMLMEPYYPQKIETEDFLRNTGVTVQDLVNLKSSLSKLEARVVSLTSEQSSLSKKLKEQEEASTKEISGLRRRVSDMERKLTSENERMKKEEKVIMEKVEKSNSAMDKKITELVATVQGLNTIASKTSTDLHEKTEEDDYTNGGPRMSTPMDDDLIGIILILIFLVSILIGINL